MEPIADQAALRPVVDSLVAKGLMIELSPAGRGQVVTHQLYKDRELAELKARFTGYVPREPPADDEPAAAPPVAAASRGVPAVTKDELAELSVEVAELRAEVSRLREQVRQLEAKLNSVLS
jgi:hypothetical protein